MREGLSVSHGKVTARLRKHLRSTALSAQQPRGLSVERDKGPAAHLAAVVVDSAICGASSRIDHDQTDCWAMDDDVAECTRLLVDAANVVALLL